MNPNNKKPLGERSHYIWQAARPDLKEFVGKIIRETRFRRNVDVPAIAQELGVSPTAIYRWERGDIGGTPALIIWWLLRAHDGNEGMDPIYWRERCLIAEDNLDRMREILYDHNESLELFLGDKSETRERSARSHNGSSIHGSNQ